MEKLFKEGKLEDNQIIMVETPKNIIVDDPIFTKRVMTHKKLQKIKKEFLNITKMAIDIPKNERLLNAYKAVEIEEKKSLG